MNKLNKLVTVMAVTTMTLGVNAGDMKKIGLANPNTPTSNKLLLFSNFKGFNCPSFLDNRMCLITVSLKLSISLSIFLSLV
jgi:hypothetical protein